MTPLKILLVENHTDTSAYLKAYLETHGDIVTCAIHGEAARPLLADDAFDVLLCDISLPGRLDGWQLLKTLGEHRPPLCIAMSGYCAPADFARSQDAGFHCHLVKPFLPAELDAALKVARG